MEVRKLGDSDNRWTFFFNCEWLQLFGRYNWYTFTFFRFEVENEKYLGNINWTFGLLGFVAGGSYTYNPEFTDAMNAEVDEWLKQMGDTKEPGTGDQLGTSNDKKD